MAMRHVETDTVFGRTTLSSAFAVSSFTFASLYLSVTTLQVPMVLVKRGHGCMVGNGETGLNFSSFRFDGHSIGIPFSASMSALAEMTDQYLESVALG